MDIDGNTLPGFVNFDNFRSKFEEHVIEFANQGLLKPKFSYARLRDAHKGWRDDVTRVQQNERRLQEGLDHFKLCGYLAFWLRRTIPVVDYDDMTAATQLKSDAGLYPGEREVRNLLYAHGAEFLAFDFGLQICAYHQKHRTDDHPSVRGLTFSRSYITNVCNFMKWKPVSPQAMYILYESLFANSFGQSPSE